MVGEPGMLIKAVRLHDLALRLISRAQCHRERPIEERAPSINRRAGARHGRKPEREGRSRSRKATEPGGGGGETVRCRTQGEVGAEKRATGGNRCKPAAEGRNKEERKKRGMTSDELGGRGSSGTVVRLARPEEGLSEVGKRCRWQPEITSLGSDVQDLSRSCSKKKPGEMSNRSGARPSSLAFNRESVVP